MEAGSLICAFMIIDRVNLLIRSLTSCDIQGVILIAVCDVKYFTDHIASYKGLLRVQVLRDNK